jgi:hypothetical protein
MRKLYFAFSKNTPIRAQAAVEPTPAPTHAFAAEHFSARSGVTPGSNRVVISSAGEGESWEWDTEPQDQVDSFASLLFVREPFRKVVRR